jgi:hypothetical protein
VEDSKKSNIGIFKVRWRLNQSGFTIVLQIPIFIYSILTLRLSLIMDIIHPLLKKISLRLFPGKEKLIKRK